jgi:two-component system NtrC family sensor kinase
MEILIADDDGISRKVLQKALEKLGHKVLLAENGLQAWELLQKSKVRLVLTDWQMPEMDGLTLCRKIREVISGYYIYIIIVTAKQQKEHVLAGLDSGADDYIVKPIDFEELAVRIRGGERLIQLEEDIKRVHTQLLHSEKMASVGQLAAGVAHEINNPTGFVSSNLKTLSDYHNDMGRLVNEYRTMFADLKTAMTAIEPIPSIADQLDRISKLETEIDIDFILNDVLQLIQESREGTERIKKIVLDLKDFAHPGEDSVQAVDINKGIESTLNVVWNEIKYKATVNKAYGDLPVVEGYPQQLNQVFMNLLVNAAQAIENKGEINIETRAYDHHVEIRISDTGCGIPQKNLSRVFDPFFTTKEVGKGTGLGLNVAYNIIKKHRGTIDVKSEVGKGSTFIIRIPVEKAG